MSDPGAKGTTGLDVVQLAGFYPPHIGGIEYCCSNLSAELVRRGHRVTVLTSTVGSCPPGTQIQDGVVVRFLRGVEFAHTPIMPSLVRELIRLPSTSLVHVHLSHVFTEVVLYLVAVLRGWRYVAHFHMDVDVSGRLGFLFRGYKRTLLPLVIRRAGAVVTLSDEQADLVVQRYRVPRDRVHVIPNGVAEEHFWDRPVASTSGRPGRLLFVGRLAMQKNLPRLVRALPHMRHDVELTVVGDGERMAEIRSVVAELGLASQVHLLGPRSGEELREIYRAADIFVLPSDREGMPLVLLEAMASGLPVVGSAVQGLREFLDGRGVLVDPVTPQAFAAALDALLDDPDRMTKLGRLGQQWVRAYSWRNLAAEVESIYTGLGTTRGHD